MSSRAARVDPAVGRQLVERGERIAVAQLRIAPAGDQLLGLREKLDLADAAAAELDVVAFDRDLAMAAIGVDLPLHRVHVGDRGEVEIFAPDEGRQLVEDRLARRDIAGAGARLDHRRAFPVLPDALVIGERRRASKSRSRSRTDRAAAADRCGTRSRRRCAPASSFTSRCVRRTNNAAAARRPSARRAPPDRRTR